jgi:DnaJ homolog subfamily C member 8
LVVVLSFYLIILIRFSHISPSTPKTPSAVHPDKCAHPRAKDAFEIIGHAQKELLDEEKRKRLDFILDAAREEVRKEWRKAAKHDAATRLAAVLEEGGREAVHAAREQTDEFHEAWKLKAREFLAKAEWRRRKLGKRMKEEEERAKDEYKVEKEHSKRKREEDKNWEASREERVSSWRDFAAGKGKKKSKSKGGGGGVGGVKPPKAKISDQEKSYVQRPVLRE